MAVREILKYEHPGLRVRARPVRRITRSVHALLDDMRETMSAAEGVGLAATQVGDNRRVVVIDVGEGPLELINPRIVSASGEEVGVEGCLSVPGLVGEVPRAARVTVSATDRHGQQVWTEGEGLLARALQHELDHLDGVLFIDRALSVTEVSPDRLRVVFLGTPEFAVPSLQALTRRHEVLAVVTQPDRPAGRGARLAPAPVKQAASDLGLEVWTDSCRDPGLIARVEALTPDVLVVVAFGQILPRRLLAVPRLGAINAHASLLPRYRGAAPIQRALMAGESVTGVTTMYMSPQLDAGDIILQEAVAILPEDNAGSLQVKLAALSARLLLRTLKLVARGESPRLAQDKALATYAPPLERDEERVDWTRPAAAVHNLVRALSPRPGAFTWRQGRRLKLLATEVVPAGGPAAPGTVVTIGAGGPVVACGDGWLELTKLQPEGGRAMNGTAYLHGHGLEPGEVLGRAERGE